MKIFGRRQGVQIHSAPQSVDLRAVGDKRFVTRSQVRIVFSRTIGERPAGSVPQQVIVPAGVRTDLGSVPRIFRPLISVAAAPVPFAVHDWLYARSGYERCMADVLMLALMDYCRTPKWRWQRRLAYWGVQLGGWAAYRRRKSNADPS